MFLNRLSSRKTFWFCIFSAIRLCFEVSYFMVWTGYCTVDYCNEILKIIGFINLRINIRYSNQSRPKNSKLQNIIWSQKKIWIKTIDSQQRNVERYFFLQKSSRYPAFWLRPKIWVWCADKFVFVRTQKHTPCSSQTQRDTVDAAC